MVVGPGQGGIERCECSVSKLHAMMLRSLLVVQPDPSPVCCKSGYESSELWDRTRSDARSYPHRPILMSRRRPIDAPKLTLEEGGSGQVQATGGCT